MESVKVRVLHTPCGRPNEILRFQARNNPRSWFPRLILMEWNTTKETKETTNREGGTAYDVSACGKLARLSINNLLESTFYREDTEAVAEVKQAFDEAADVDAEFILQLAAYCREEAYLRDISQLLLVMASRDDRTQEYVRDYAPLVIQRADEPATCLAINAQLSGGATPTKPLTNAINDALRSFDEYEFGKYAQSRREWSMVDVFNVTHPTPQTEQQEALFESVVRGDLDDYPDVDPIPTPDTWEAHISDKGNTAEAWRDVLPNMGIFATVRNLRNMLEAGVPSETIAEMKSIEVARQSKMYPFRLYQAYQAVGKAGLLDDDISEWLSGAIDLTTQNISDEFGNTLVAVDTSGSMDQSLSSNSSMTVMEIAMFFGAAMSQKGADVAVFADNTSNVAINPDAPTLSRLAEINTAGHEVGGSTNGWKIPKVAYTNPSEYDRVVFLTDMQLWDSSGGVFSSRNRTTNTLRDEFIKYRDRVPHSPRAYMIDLASYGSVQFPESESWAVQVGGWSEQVLDFVVHNENMGLLMDDIRSMAPTPQ